MFLHIVQIHYFWRGVTTQDKIKWDMSIKYTKKVYMTKKGSKIHCIAIKITTSIGLQYNYCFFTCKHDWILKLKPIFRSAWISMFMDAI